MAQGGPGPADPPRKKIVLIAGPITGHPKGAHEYEKSVILIKQLLETSPNVAERVRVEAHFKGWPADDATLDDADTVVMITDGGDRNPADHPLYAGDRLQRLGRQIRRGCGFVQLHWTTFNPAAQHDTITEWVGGYFDYETGPAPNRWYSAITLQDWDVALPTPGHPICRGVRPFHINEEFYHHIRFRDADPRLTPVASIGPGAKNEGTVGWAVQRADGGRGFGFTGGHFYENWWNEDFRRLLLNAVVWSAGVEVPEGGVRSEPGAKIRALILTGHHSPHHDWNDVTAALVGVLELDPRMVVRVSEDIEDLATDAVRGADLLVMNYNNWERPGLSAKAKENFTRALDGGTGLAVIHFANGAFNETIPGNKESDWPEYRTKIVRRVWVHPTSAHDPFGPFAVRITDIKHPITAGLAPFDTVDELYFAQGGDLPIEPLAVARSAQTKQDEPLAWAYAYGKGRVFQTLLGHSGESIRKAGALIRRGCVWSAGRDNLLWDPPARITEHLMFRDGSPWKPHAPGK